MKTYFSRITSDYWADKNKASIQAKQVARDMDRILISEDEMQQFQETFISKINKVNSDNRKCKDLYLDIWRTALNDKDVQIMISGVFHMTLFEVKQ